ncbi:MULTISPECIES: YbhB/YbcL family Raf kinase inhibitor-like protein [Parachlamydia]|jgi:Raf kinase inhibitor-like YbhB/YbcL family protein|uniref:UPF0098 protein MTH_273 n=2 Tax=Parachlamydia acanthamoebae TaxID=83552 RepID=F8KZ45_PARAV|nr:YbhB/YbcL family Raf kinase inhibitor-like protein [Parachlamydia acanthamoebae]EFB41955.1 PEBP family protein [Parachlamydia acanthamoebae str. Hall's coccus]CCB86168.1 UPF0098 protein MTH_273 [Parachlamydia acanthamoebae UV-7]
MEIASPAFEHEQKIPQKYTCEGEDLSPPLEFHNVPDGAKSLTLIIEDPDAPKGVFDHWIVWNLPPTTQLLEEGAHVPMEGKNGFQVDKYRGPCPPPGNPHRYVIQVYALDIKLNLPKGSSKKSVLDAMGGHILAKAVLIGKYQR